MLDGHGNYLHCLDSIVAALDVHIEQLHRQHVIKHWQKHQPIVELRKEEVEQQRPEEYVLHDDDDDDV